MLRPNVRAAINFEDVDPVVYKKTLAFINNFVINTTQFMNRFSYLCEEKLSSVSRDIQRLEITMSLLEAKLVSIPGMDQITTPLAEDAPATAVAATPNAADAAAPIAPNAPPPPPPPSAGPVAPSAAPTARAQDDDDFDSDSDDDNAGGGGAAVAAAAAGEPPALMMKDDPRYERYFKMVKMGVMVAQVKQKMQMEGINPNILEYVVQ
jgi:WASH complex subunit CCDC53